MEAVFKLDNVDFSNLLEEGGIKWSRNDLDSDATGRDLTGRMRRKRIATKRKLGFTCLRMDTETMMRLNEALMPQTVKVTYLDPIDGISTRTFYGSTVEATTQIVINGETYWEGTAFSLIEM